MNKENTGDVLSKVRDAVASIEDSAANPQLENVLRTKIIGSEKPELSLTEEQKNQILPSTESVKIDEKQILEVVKPVFVRAAYEAQRTDISINPDLLNRYNSVVGRALNNGFITQNEIKSGVESLQNSEETKAKKIERAKELAVSALQKADALRFSLDKGASLDELISIQSELGAINIDDLDEETKSQLILAQTRIENAIKALKDELAEEAKKSENDKQVLSVLDMLFQA